MSCIIVIYWERKNEPMAKSLSRISAAIQTGRSYYLIKSIIQSTGLRLILYIRHHQIVHSSLMICIFSIFSRSSVTGLTVQVYDASPAPTKKAYYSSFLKNPSRRARLYSSTPPLMVYHHNSPMSTGTTKVPIISFAHASSIRWAALPSLRAL